ncbi:MAG: stage II sporulation protein M [Candidatus Woesearchaeota archaeon]|jgi:uncharacterized membrane protein SpoIIM required for sporulation|nr:stage II sporulation protein M [Candidatus Woesearchaeota archaeon]MDP7324419.1 stage II sporulation protein M [Candidatus Woesearchaeota archaeon]MDP7457928.1 stage II sporulation protein M [Candidatus Woesearchaeota archaeon]|tara:strand:- start:1145 stop:1996 length:852 start_codon:yes stop_codon:yes gene_type:complete
MVIESLTNPLKAEHRPWTLFFIGIIYSTLGVFLSLWIFREYASLVMIFLISLACVPLVYATIRFEEKKDFEILKQSLLLKEHSKALTFLMFLFLGITVSLTFWYLVFPTDISSNLFAVQTGTIVNINNQVSGNAVSAPTILTRIFLNNFKVLLFCLLFSFIYGLGAIFILTWNASVIAAALGNFIRVNMAKYVSAVGFLKVGAYLQVASLGFMRYAIHGIPEILAYFVGGLAGGIISIAIIKHDFGTPSFSRIVFDSADLIMVSIALLVFAAIVEVYITPVLF